jgi:hypothetical protein
VGHDEFVIYKYKTRHCNHRIVAAFSISASKAVYPAFLYTLYVSIPSALKTASILCNIEDYPNNMSVSRTKTPKA